ncbi:MAG: 5'/3'-nucleotidase SurE [Candidatus ainarchaeum sp.]|nr:5'/3'-nucleotidase SurE [Candidatus ainarchaeum sp.]
MVLMVTNDDGLTDGLRLLAEAAKELDEDFYAITPSQQQSAVAKGVTLHRILRLRKAVEESLPIYELNGTPADCVTFGVFSGEFRKPDMVLSGVNISDNLSLHSFFSSGTIGACIEAAFYKIPAIAFSFELHGEERERYNYCIWEKRAALKEKIGWIAGKLKGKIPDYTVVNVNFPADFENSQVVFPRPALVRYVTKIEKRVNPNGHPYYWQYGTDRECERGSDVYEFYVNKSITITPISIFGVVDEKALARIKAVFQ